MDQQGRPYSVEKYNPAWKMLFETEQTKLETLLQDLDLVIEHIGSTSVEGLWAKPQIDMLVIVKNLNDVRDRKADFEREEYKCLGDYAGSNEEYIVKDEVMVGDLLASM